LKQAKYTHGSKRGPDIASFPLQQRKKYHISPLLAKDLKQEEKKKPPEVPYTQTLA